MSERNLQVFSDAIALSGGVQPWADLNPAADALIDDVSTLEGLANIVGAPINARGGKIQGFLTSSDMPALIEGVARRVVSDTSRFSLAHRAIAGRISAPNFKSVTISRVIASELTKRLEGEASAPAALATYAENVRLDTYSAFFGFSREAAISAAWDTLVQSVAELVAGAYRLERSMLVALLNANPSLADGTQLFHADRSNVVTGALTEANLGTAMSLLRSMPGADGNALETEPRVLCVPASSELSARKILKDADVPLSVFVDSRLTGSFLLPDPQVTPVLALVHLEGSDRPRTNVARRMASNDTWRVSATHDVAVAAVGERAVRISE